MYFARFETIFPDNENGIKSIPLSLCHKIVKHEI